jgi:hypothetical protein
MSGYLSWISFLVISQYNNLNLKRYPLITNLILSYPMVSFPILSYPRGRNPRWLTDAMAEHPTPGQAMAWSGVFLCCPYWGACSNEELKHVSKHGACLRSGGLNKKTDYAVTTPRGQPPLVTCPLQDSGPPRPRTPVAGVAGIGRGRDRPFLPVFTLRVHPSIRCHSV